MLQNESNDVNLRYSTRSFCWRIRPDELRSWQHAPFHNFSEKKNAFITWKLQQLLQRCLFDSSARVKLKCLSFDVRMISNLATGLHMNIWIYIYIHTQKWNVCVFRITMRNSQFFVCSHFVLNFGRPSLVSCSSTASTSATSACRTASSSFLNDFKESPRKTSCRVSNGWIQLTRFAYSAIRLFASVCKTWDTAAPLVECATRILRTFKLHQLNSPTSTAIFHSTLYL